MPQTLARDVRLSGVGLHTGCQVCARVLPRQEPGRVFVRVDLPDRPQIPARWDRVRQTQLSTELAEGDATVRTVEHLLSSLGGLGIDRVAIEIDGPELPVLDGSAVEWVRAIANAGMVEVPDSDRFQASPPDLQLAEPIWVRKGDAFVAALPASELQFTYGIDFPGTAIGNQWYSWYPGRETYAKAIAPARTFAIRAHIEKLRASGLIRGGSLENALVCTEDSWLNPPLRFANEPVRHKILDLIGDLSLLGPIPSQIHFLAYKASHALHLELARLIAEELHQQVLSS